MNSINRLGLITAMVTAAFSLGVSQLYFAIDERVHLGNHYASLFQWLPGDTLPNGSKPAVAGIKDIASPTPEPTISPRGKYTSLYIAEQGSGVSEADLFAKERLNTFVAQHTAMLNEAQLRQTLPVSTLQKTQLLSAYTSLPMIYGEDLVTQLTVPATSQPAASVPLINKIESALLLMQRTGTSPDMAPVLERHAALLTLSLQNLRLIADTNKDFVGGILGGAQLKEVAGVLEQSTTALKQAILNPNGASSQDCGLCLEGTDLLNAAVGTAASPSSSPVPVISPLP